MTDINTANLFAVSLSPALTPEIVIQALRPFQRLSKADAINLAAWLIAIADPGRKRFEEVFKAVMET